jgi:diadenosine tetraphosphate (Ap4A) HIT family hydrolase
MTNCPFCLHEGGKKIWQDQLCRVVLVEEATYPGLCRVITQQHVKEMTDLSRTEQVYIMQVVFTVEKVMREILQPDKINLASLGNQVPHMHWHIIPRYFTDPHFPEPIWATAHLGRQPKQQSLQNLTRFTQCLQKALSTLQQAAQ